VIQPLVELEQNSSSLNFELEISTKTTYIN